MSPIGANIYKVGAVSPVGIGLAQISAAIGARVDAFKETSIRDSRFQVRVMALVPDEALPPLNGELGKAGLSVRAERMLRLGSLALQDCLEDLPDSIPTSSLPLFVATPEQHPGLKESSYSELAQQLAAQAELEIDLDASQCFSAGRAGGLEALQAGLEYLASGKAEFVLIGGVDTFLDLMLLAQLDSEGRVLAPDIMDGFVPGEGAAFLLLGAASANAPAGLEAIAHIPACSTGVEEGHRYSEEPYRGDGLAAVFSELLETPDALRQPVRTIYAGLNGESFSAKEYGVACSRSSASLESERVIEHPADCFGDAGAALVPLMLSLAASSCRREAGSAPCLVWASSDGPTRGAALVDVVSPGV